MGSAKGNGIATPTGFDGERYRHVIGHFATGVTVITSNHDGIDHGATASAVSSVSLDPPSLLVCLNRAAVTETAVRESGTFVVNILREDQGELAMRFAGRHGEKFERLEVGRSGEGDPVLLDALARVECRVRDAVTGGTHTVFFGEVQRAEASEGDPLAYFRGRFGRLSPELDLSELCEETFAARSAIELGVVELTVGKVGAGAVARLRALMETTRGLIADGHFNDVPGWAEANAAFHEAHVALAGSEPLTESYRRLSVAGLILRTYTDATDADPELAGDHRRLVEAYEHEDVEAARQAVREHADRAARSQRAAIAAGEECPASPGIANSTASNSRERG
jgi:4-nitrophenol 2-monooxygenase / 4-nitrocatechol 4-monooxygenase, reductase component